MPCCTCTVCTGTCIIHRHANAYSPVASSGVMGRSGVDEWAQGKRSKRLQALETDRRPEDALMSHSVKRVCSCMCSQNKHFVQRWVSRASWPSWERLDIELHLILIQCTSSRCALQSLESIFCTSTDILSQEFIAGTVTLACSSISVYKDLYKDWWISKAQLGNNQCPSYKWKF